MHKNPSRLQTEELSFGKGYVIYPEATNEVCTAALLIEVDPVSLVRGRGPAGEGGQLEQYVNDRRYSANFFLSVAMGRIFAMAIFSDCRACPDRQFGPHVIRNQSQQLRRSLRGLELEGIRHVFKLSSPGEVDGLTIERHSLWNISADNLLTFTDGQDLDEALRMAPRERLSLELTGSNTRS